MNAMRTRPTSEAAVITPTDSALFCRKPVFWVSAAAVAVDDAEVEDALEVIEAAAAEVGNDWVAELAVEVADSVADVSEVAEVDVVAEVEVVADVEVVDVTEVEVVEEAEVVLEVEAAVEDVVDKLQHKSARVNEI